MRLAYGRHNKVLNDPVNCNILSLYASQMMALLGFMFFFISFLHTNAEMVFFGERHKIISDHLHPLILFQCIEKIYQHSVSLEAEYF